LFERKNPDSAIPTGTIDGLKLLQDTCNPGKAFWKRREVFPNQSGLLRKKKKGNTHYPYLS
jgi:hypothetical protein